MKTLVVLPTYNEVKNIEKVLEELLKFDFLDVLVVDDSSPDGTADKVKKIMEKEKRVYLIERPRKLGLGTAYITGFRWGMEKEYECFFEIDADLSHDPNDIPKFIEKLEEGFDLVIGSRYMNNKISVVGWDFKRLLLSKFANWYAIKILGLKGLSDVTSGYRAYRKRCLEKIGLDKVKSNGYAFQIEMVYRAVKKSCKVAEVPIIFYERNSGCSKMTKKIALEAALTVWKLRFL